MAKKFEADSPASFDYELYEGDPDHLTTVVATPTLPSPYIEPESLKLKYRIGHGIFGDVWLATHHQSGADYDEYHEVAVKMLRTIKEDHMKDFLSKLEDLWMSMKSQQLQGVCWLHGIAVLSGKICIVMKFYEGSIGDRMAQLKGGKLPLPLVLRYGIELTKGIQELHSLGMLALNLKPTNFLLSEKDQVVLGDFGIPNLLLGIPLPDADFDFRLGTPHYMAPEQWRPEIRGPITLETDSWGFGCSIVEMLTGVQPWCGRSVKEIYQLVVMNQEKPQLPDGLPPAVENVLNGCFQYDFRNRPLMADIQQAFESSQNAVYSDGEWTGLGSRLLVDKSSSSSYTLWFFSKDHLQVGDTVRSRRSMNSQKMTVEEGTVVGLEKDTDRDGHVLVRIPCLHNPLRVNVSSLERVTSGFASGDWVRLMKEDLKHSPLGVLHSIERDGSVSVAFLGLETLWKGHCSEFQIAEPYFIGQFVRLKASVLKPRFEWLHKKGETWATGRIFQILPNGCLVVTFPGRFTFGEGQTHHFLADPDEVELVTFDTCPGVVEKYQHIEDFHWAVRPVAIAFGLLTTIKIGAFVGGKIGGRLKKGKGNQIHSDGQAQDGQSSGNLAWLPSKVANILFKEGSSTTAVR